MQSLWVPEIKLPSWQNNYGKYFFITCSKISMLSFRICALLFVSGIMTLCDFSFWGKNPPDKACGLNERKICSQSETSCGVLVTRQMNKAFKVVFRCQSCSRFSRSSVSSQGSLSGKCQHQHHWEPHHQGRVLGQREEWLQRDAPPLRGLLRDAGHVGDVDQMGGGPGGQDVTDPDHGQDRWPSTNPSTVSYQHEFFLLKYAPDLTMPP